MNKIKQLPLHDFHLKNSAKFTSFAGWQMPLSYGSSVTEHIKVRQQFGFFDVSHMGEILIKGSQSLDFLNFIMTNDLRKISDGQAIYTLMCNHTGGVIDDLIVYRISSEEFFLCVNASNTYKDFLHLKELSKSFDCLVQDVSGDFGLIAVQGPKSVNFMEEIFEEKFSHIERMHFAHKSFCGLRSLVARTGYTGEDGFEIFLPMEIIAEFSKIIDSRKDRDRHSWIGLAARDSLRLEAGFCLHGHEISEKISPIEARLKWAVSFSKADFIGKQALENQLNDKSLGQVLHYNVKDRRIPREGNSIFWGENLAGRVLSGGYSPTIKSPIGTAYIERDFLEYKTSKEWFAEVRGNFLPINFSKSVLKN